MGQHAVNKTDCYYFDIKLSNQNETQWCILLIFRLESIKMPAINPNLGIFFYQKQLFLIQIDTFAFTVGLDALR